MGTVITAISNGIQNVIKYGLNFEDYNWKELNNSWKIDTGMFSGNFGQIVNNLTWGSVNNKVGNFAAHGYNLAGQVDGVTNLGGTTAIETKRSGNGAFTLGSYINGPRGFKANWRDHLFVHEYGPVYFNRFGIPSARKGNLVEFDANSRGYSYFYKKTGGNFTWDFGEHPLRDGINWGLRGDFHNDPQFQLSLSNSLVSPNWTDYGGYIFGGDLGLIFHGLFQSIVKD
jgi:hypothetical protein